MGDCRQVQCEWISHRATGRLIDRSIDLSICMAFREGERQKEGLGLGSFEKQGKGKEYINRWIDKRTETISLSEGV